MKNPFPISTAGKFLLAFIGVFATLWILVITESFYLPLYLDSLFTVGAGAKLAEAGHFSSTFMLYGLINPYILEALLFFKLGALAPYVLRLIQFLIALTGFLFLARAYSQGEDNLQHRLGFFSIVAVVLSSTVMLIEAFEPTPENATLCIFSILFYLLTVYKPGKRHCILIGLTLALLAGTRPTALILALPVFLVVPESSSAKSYARRYWRWIVLVIISCTAILTAFSKIVSVTKLSLIALPLLFFLTIISFIHDKKNGHSRVWNELFFIFASFIVLLPLLFPNYFLHFQDLIRQTNQYHIEVEHTCNSIAIMGKSILYSFLYLTVAFPGPFGATGFFTAIGLFLSKRKKIQPNHRTLSLFAMGVIPFILIVTRNENFQSRYLIPLMGLFFTVASIGIRHILSSKLKYLLLIPFLISSYQLIEVVQHKTNGGILNAFYNLSTEEQATVQVQNIGPCHPHYYGESRNIFYPLLPYASSNRHVMNSGNALYSISFTEPPACYDVIGIYGNTHEDRDRQVRASNNPVWADFVFLTGKPWIWRGWTVAYLAVLK